MDWGGIVPPYQTAPCNLRSHAVVEPIGANSLAHSTLYCGKAEMYSGIVGGL